MKRLMLLVACGLLAGCDYTVPLVTSPEIALDKNLLGLWQRTAEDGKEESLLVLPLGRKEHLIWFPANNKESGFARACLCRTAGRTLVQLEWIGTPQGKLPDDSRVFQYATYSVAGDTLTVRLLNPEVVNKDAKSSAELASAIAQNTGRPDLFREPMVFRQLKR
jgi:hypothetical protein